MDVFPIEANHLDMSDINLVTYLLVTFPADHLYHRLASLALTTKQPNHLESDYGEET